MRILFLAPRILGTNVTSRKLATFHEADVQLLRELGHQVDVMPWRGHPYLSLLRRAAQAELIYVWTVGDHTALALAAGWLLENPVLVVIGGYEFADLPDIGYGNLTRWRGRRWSHLAWRRADALLFVDASLQREGESAFGPRRRGIAETVPTGYDGTYWTPAGDKEDLVLTVAHAPGTPNISLKGIDRFLSAAVKLPKLTFHIVGELPHSVWDDVSANVSLHGWMERDSVRHLMRRARVYCQLSRHEGLPNALCEAMLCGCIPVGTAVNGIPNAMGDAGVITTEPGSDALAIMEAYRMSLSHGGPDAARQRILNLFPLRRRRDSLQAILAKLGDG